MVRLRQLERSLLVLGVVFVAVYLGSVVDQSVMSHLYISRFSPAQANQSRQPLRTFGTRWLGAGIQDWSNERVVAYQRALSQRVAASPVAILRISRVSIVAPVLEGTDGFALNRGVGHISGTAGPDDEGNFAIAGHRDGFFRALKDVSIGDTIEIELRQRIDLYRVTSTRIVDPTDVSVLRKHPNATLTLVTCYPFYFIGNAPKRFIVEAIRAGSVPLHGLRELAAGMLPENTTPLNQIPKTTKPTKEKFNE